MSLLVDLTVEGFEKQFESQPVGIWSAPGRVNVIGEHTDYNDGFVLPMAINRRTFVAVSPRDDQRIRVATSFTDKVIEVSLDAIEGSTELDWAAYPLGVAWALQNLAGGSVRGFDAYFHSDVPVGAGLSSSAAIECSLALALNDLFDLGLERKALARACQSGENNIAGAPTGIMDQTASLLGEQDRAVMIDCRDLSIRSINLGFAAAELELLIIDTRVAHRLVDGGYAARRAACEAGAATLGVKALRDVSVDRLPEAKELLDDVTYRRVRHVVTENQRVLDFIDTLDASGPRAVGNLLLESHKSMRDDFEISIDELDTAVDVAIRHGAIGARMTGGGFGGAAIALVPLERASEITLAIKAEFELLGYAEPNIFSVNADAGARRER